VLITLRINPKNNCLDHDWIGSLDGYKIKVLGSLSRADKSERPQSRVFLAFYGRRLVFFDRIVDFMSIYYVHARKNYARIRLLSAIFLIILISSAVAQDNLEDILARTGWLCPNEAPRIDLRR
jgi:hypothetical protein